MRLRRHTALNVVTGFVDPVILLTVPTVPTVIADTSLISETPVSVPVDLTIPAVPTVTADTSLISETPVSETVDLTVPAVPSVTVSTDVNEDP